MQYACSGLIMRHLAPKGRKIAQNSLDIGVRGGRGYLTAKSLTSIVDANGEKEECLCLCIALDQSSKHSHYEDDTPPYSDA